MAQDVAAEQAPEKLKFLSFRGTLRAEESLILLTLEPREIPHLVRNDKIAYFFRILKSRVPQCFQARNSHALRKDSNTQAALNNRDRKTGRLKPALLVASRAGQSWLLRRRGLQIQNPNAAACDVIGAVVILVDCAPGFQGA